MSCTSSDLDKTPAKFQKDQAKIVGGVGSQDTQCLNALSPKMTKSELRKKMTKINLRITAKRHAHLQTLTKTPVKFQKDPGKTNLLEELHSQDFVKSQFYLSHVTSSVSGDIVCFSLCGQTDPQGKTIGLRP